MVQDVAYEHYKIPAFVTNVGISIIDSSIEERIKVSLFDLLDPYVTCSTCKTPAIFISGSQDNLVRPKRVNQMFKVYGTKTDTPIHLIKKNYIECGGNHTDLREDNLIESCFRLIDQEFEKYTKGKAQLEAKLFNMGRYIRIKGVKNPRQAMKVVPMKPQTGTQPQTNTRFDKHMAAVLPKLHNIVNSIRITGKVSAYNSLDDRTTSTGTAGNGVPQKQPMIPSTNLRTSLLRSTTQKEYTKENHFSNNSYHQNYASNQEAYGDPARSKHRTAIGGAAVGFTNQKPRHFGTQVPVAGNSNQPKPELSKQHTRARSFSNFVNIFPQTYAVPNEHDVSIQGGFLSSNSNSNSYSRLPDFTRSANNESIEKGYSSNNVNSNYSTNPQPPPPTQHHTPMKPQSDLNFVNFNLITAPVDNQAQVLSHSKSRRNLDNDPLSHHFRYNGKSSLPEINPPVPKPALVSAFDSTHYRSSTVNPKRESPRKVEQSLWYDFGFQSKLRFGESLLEDIKITEVGTRKFSNPLTG